MGRVTIEEGGIAPVDVTGIPVKGNKVVGTVINEADPLTEVVG